MNKFCKKCGKEIPLNSKKDTCEDCQNKVLKTLRKIVQPVLAVLGIVATFALNAFLKGKFGGGPKA